MKRFDLAPFIYKHFKALMFREHGTLITYVGTMCKIYRENAQLIVSQMNEKPVFSLCMLATCSVGHRF